MGGYPPQGVPKGVTKHTELTDKEVAGVIDHADASVTTSKVKDLNITEEKIAPDAVTTSKVKDLNITDAKLASGVGLSDGQICKLPTAAAGNVLKRGIAAWEAGNAALSELIIDVAKDWEGYKIANLGEPTAANDVLRNARDSELVKRVFESIQKHLGVFWFNNNWLPEGMVASEVSGSGFFSWGTHAVSLQTGNTAGSYAAIYKMAYGLFEGAATWEKKRYFGVYVDVGYTDQIVHIVTGSIIDYTSPDNIDLHVGFKLIDNALYGTVADSASESTLLLKTLTSPEFLRLECIFIPGVECRFYVEGVDKGAITTNLPSGVDDAMYMLSASIYNRTAAANKVCSLFESRTYQEE
jgi:hypothetical protein